MNLHVCIGRLMSQALRQWVHLFWALTALLAPAISQGQAMTMAGQFSVSQSGAATYSIPIQVPPGTAGMEPKLALVYNSQSGNGMLGMGWSLSGLSAITRCPRTMAQDGSRGTVNLDNNDRLCLDGQRLIRVTPGGNYWDAGSEYRTEMDGFHRVRYDGSGFVIQSKSGSTMEYGKTVDSRIEAQGGIIRAWAINKIADFAANFINFSYFKDTLNGDYFPSKISYSGSGKTGVAPSNYIEFLYDQSKINPVRRDVITRYQAGSKIKLTKRLDLISISAGGLAKEYRVLYESQENLAKPSRLSSVTECSSGMCLPPVYVSYGGEFIGEKFKNAKQQWTGTLSGISFAHSWKGDGVELVDLNGDGLMDILMLGYYTRGEFGGGSVKLAYINTGSGFLLDNKWVKDVDSIFTHGYSPDAGLRVLDLDGDGLPDLLHLAYYTNGEYGGGLVKKAYRNTGSGFVKDDRWTEGVESVFRHGYSADTGARIVDLNGDGLPDILQLAYYTNWQYGGGDKRFTYINNGRGFDKVDAWVVNVESVFAHDYSPDAGLRIVDLNGDGLPDLLHLAYYSNGEYGGGLVKKSYINTGTGFSPDDRWLKGVETVFGHNYIGDAGARIVDLNGDGLLDILHLAYYTNGEYGGGSKKLAYINTGAGFVSDDGWVKNVDSIFAHGYSPDAGLRLVDLNGDGLPDLIHLAYYTNYEYGGGSVKMSYINTGSGFERDDSWVSGVDSVFRHGYSADTGARIVDLNGDGLPDILHLAYYTNAEYGGGFYANAYINNSIKLKNGVAQPINQMISVKSGVAITDVTYGWMIGANGIYDPGGFTSPIGSVYGLRSLNSFGVSMVNASNGVGALNSTEYKYGALKADVGTGRGLLGFRWMKSREAATGIESYTEFRQDFPYIGVPLKTETRLVSGSTNMLLKRTSSQFDCRATAQAGVGLLSNASTGCGVQPGKVYFPYASVTDEESWDLNGVQMPRIRTSNSYSGVNDTSGTQRQLGDPTQIQVDLFEGSSLRQRKLTSNEYAPPNTSNWTQLGRLRKASVTSTNY